MSFHCPERYRFRQPGNPLHTEPNSGNNGAFVVALRRNQTVQVIASDGAGWEHVSVSRRDRCPSWEEMCQVKEIFWDAEDVVLQFHPAESQYVNNHAYCLHLWRPVDIIVPTPPAWMVGIITPAKQGAAA